MRDKKGRFVKGNTISAKGKRLCANYPFCKERINTEKYPNMRYHSPTCRKYASIYKKRNNLIEKREKTE